MIFRLIKEEEKEILLSMYNHDRNTSYTGWNEYYPTMDNINNDINNNNLFVLEDNNVIIGSISINSENELDDLEEFTKTNKKIAEFGRVIINPKYRGLGYSNLLIQNIEKEILKRDIHHIHICVFNNAPLQAKSLYINNKYIQVGYKELFGINFILFEKIL